MKLQASFKINGWVHKGILEVLMKNLLNLISFSLIPPNFGGNEDLRSSICMKLQTSFKINGWMHKGILEFLMKNLLNLISFSLIPPNFGGNEDLRFWLLREYRGISLP